MNLFHLLQLQRLRFNKTVQDLKMEIEIINRTQTEGISEMENLEKRTGIIVLDR